MKVWIIRKSEEYNDSKKILKEIYFKITNNVLDENKINYGKYGKPYYENFNFNISHSKNYISIVVSNKEVGIDIEERKRKIYNRFEDKILAKDEKKINSNILNNWVIKEAYLKFLGVGLSLDVKTINANYILKNNLIYNISEKDFICYVIGKEKLEQVTLVFNRIDSVVRCYYDNIRKN